MELKYTIALLTVLSVGFIIVAEIYFYESHSYSSDWNKPKSDHTPSKYKQTDIHANDEVQSSVKDTLNHPWGKKLMTSVDNNFDLESEDDREDDAIHVRSGGKKWRNWIVASTMAPHISFVKGFRRKNRLKLMKMKEEGLNMNDEEKLRISPYIYHEDQERKRSSAPIVEREVKYISYFLPSGRKKKLPTFSHCRYSKCAYVNNLSQADLVGFAANHIRDNDILTFHRPPGQRWLMYTVDPAIRRFDLDRDSIKSLFNYTHTYNLDSDIPFLFGRLQKKVPLPTEDFEQLYEGKSKLVAWFVSHCNTASKREDYVKMMQLVLEVDVFGECGNRTCGGERGANSRAIDGTVCLPMLSNTYKFYLAFENSYCLDYVTEKFFKLFQDIHIIPVVRGGFQYKKYLPSGIYVDADDFETPADLARYLVELGNDKQRYTEMLRKKNEWRLVRPQPRECTLCEYLHSNPPSQFYPDLSEKFGRNTCYYPKAFWSQKKD